MPLDVKIFDLEAWGSKNIQMEDFSIQGPCPWMLKPLIWTFGESKNIQIKGLGTKEHPN